MEIPGYLTTDQAAQRLGVNRQTIYNLANQAPDFPRPVKIGRASLWPADEVDAWRTNHPARRKRSTAEPGDEHAGESPP